MNIYSTLQAKNFDEGVGFIATLEGAAIEIQVYGGVVIAAKSMRMAPAEILGVLSRGEVKEISTQAHSVDPGLARASVITCTFPAAADALLDKARATPARLLRLVRLVPALIRSDKDEGAQAFDLMRRRIAARYPGFLPDAGSINARMLRLEEELGIHVGGDEALPSDIASAPDWIFRRFDALGDDLLRDLATYFVLFGELSPNILVTTAERVTSLGAKPGRANLSKVAYPGFESCTSASVFKGAERLGQIGVDWRPDRNKPMTFTKADLERLGLTEGDRLTVILTD